MEEAAIVRSGGDVERLGAVRDRAVVLRKQVAGTLAMHGAELAADRMQPQAVRGVALHSLCGAVRFRKGARTPAPSTPRPFPWDGL